MSKDSPEDAKNITEPSGGGTGTVPSQQSVSPYATGGGGVTFERKVAVLYLTHLLVGDNTTELGDGRRIVSVAFQQAPDHPVDDLVVSAARPDELQPSLVLTLGIRRSLNLVLSDEPTRKLTRQLVRAVIDVPAGGPQRRLALVVAGPQSHAEQLAKLAHLATVQMDAPGFFKLVQTPGKFDASLRGRLDQFQKLVECALHELGVVEGDTELVEKRTWQLLSILTVTMPRLESPDETDWSGVVNSLKQVARNSDLLTASRLRDRLVALASNYSPRAARVDLTILRRDSHTLLDPTTRRHQDGWQTLDSIHRRTCECVRAEITSSDGDRSVCLDRSAAAMELVKTVSGAEAVVVTGESGVGKSALAVLGLGAAVDTKPGDLQVVCINLRQIPCFAITFEGMLVHPLLTLLSELSAPQRMLVVDGADAATEDKYDVFLYLVDAALGSGVKMVAVTSTDSKQVVLDVLSERFDTAVAEYAVPPLGDSEIDEIVGTFSELERLSANPRSRELLRRLIVVDLLVRGQISGTPLTDADAMNEVWSGLVRRREMSDRGFPDARETAILRLAKLELGEGERLEVINGIDPAALDGLRRDGLLRTPPEAPHMIGPEFAHDEVRRYAVARLLLASDNPASRLLRAGAPRWSLATARLACQAWLGRPDTPTMPLEGRFAALQTSFEALGADHGSRWGDVPGEALLTLANPEALLRDAWPELLADDGGGLRRLARLVDQRLRDENGVVDVIAVAPIIALLLEAPSPWQSGKHTEGIFRAWLRGHVIADTAVGHPLRILLRQRLVEACAAGDRHLAEQREAAATARAARTPEEIEHERQFVEKHGVLFTEIGYGGRRPRQRPEVPREIKDKVVLELLALLGPDLGDDGEAILTRVAKDAPSWLAPAVDEFFTGRALACGRHGLLAELIEAYYLDDEYEVGEFDIHEDGVRPHRARGFGRSLAAWARGPFLSLFQSDFRNGVRVLNRLLNHAARIRSCTLADLDQVQQPLQSDTVGLYESELNITGERQLYFGDEHVWRWYRGNAVGPYPCFSALQALERECDRLIDNGVLVGTLIPILLDGCENLAMVGLIVGLLVRHLEDADHLLDPYFTESLIWRQEFARVANEVSRLAANSEGLVAPERRNWSLRKAAMFMVVHANGERIAELRALGETLILNARRVIEPAQDHEPTETESRAEFTEHQLVIQARAWASSLDRERYQAHKTEDGFYVEPTPPDDVVKALQDNNEDLERKREAIRLVARYHIDPRKEGHEAIGRDELEADIASLQKRIENPPSLGSHDLWDASVLVAAAALEAHLLEGVSLPDDALSFATGIVLQIGEGVAWPRQYEFEDTFYEQGADRSAARVLPLLLLPVAAQLRAVVDEENGSTTFERAFHAGVNLAQAEQYEVRLHLARGLDHVWKTPCVKEGLCHHDLGWRIAVETMRSCVFGAQDIETGRRSVLTLKEPVTESLASTNDDSIRVSQLDAAIRALAPATMANICVSSQAREFLLTLLAAQRRSLLIYEHHDQDPRGSHTLVSARALLTLARDANDAAIYDHIDAYADNSSLLDNLLRALSVAAEETPERAATARRIWPNVVRHVLQLNRSGHKPFAEAHYGDMALAALIPNTTGEFLYREVDDSPIVWWDPLELVPDVEAWLAPAAGNATCIDRLINFVSALEPDDQVRVGLPWVVKLVAADPDRIARGTYMLPIWLIEMRSVAVDAGLLTSWQQVVDVLVVAGVAQLAPYSD